MKCRLSLCLVLIVATAVQAQRATDGPRNLDARAAAEAAARQRQQEAEQQRQRERNAQIRAEQERQQQIAAQQRQWAAQQEAARQAELQKQREAWDRNAAQQQAAQNERLRQIQERSRRTDAAFDAVNSALEQGRQQRLRQQQEEERRNAAAENAAAAERSVVRTAPPPRVVAPVNVRQENSPPPIDPEREERLRREEAAARLQVEANEMRRRAVAIAEGVALTEASAREGGADTFSALLLSPAPAVKKLADTIIDVAGTLGGGSAKVVAGSYKFVGDGVDLAREAGRGSAAGVITETGSLVNNLGKVADRLSGENYQDGLKGFDRAVKLGEAGRYAAEGDVLRSADKVADAFLPSPAKAVKSGVVGAVGVGLEIEKAAQANDELMQLFQQNQARAQNDRAQFGAKAREFEVKAEALEAEARKLEQGSPTTGTGERMVLPDIPITVPRAGPAAKSGPAIP